MTDAEERPEGAGSTNDAAGEEHRLIAERRAKLRALRERVPVPFPNDFEPSHGAGALQTAFAHASRETLAERAVPVAVAGRIVADRGAFLVLQDGSGRIQAYVNRKVLPTEALEARKGFDLGDIVAVRGTLARSGKGDLYVDAAELRLLVKALRPLPTEYYGLADVEQRYRQRYLDLIVNEETREVFRMRSRIVQAFRDWFVAQDFLEVETPMMHPIPGGATARPFVTHHNALDMPLYLRVAPELYLKRLVVGGFERVFEINRNFRNEGLSPRHNPEFTMLEFYWAYRDHTHLMDATETLLADVARKVIGDTRITWQGHAVDLAGPYRRLTVAQALETVGEVPGSDLDDPEALRRRLRAEGVEAQGDWGPGRLRFELFEAVVEAKLIEPTFITAHPTEVSPLARQSDADPTVTDRFELYVCGREIANGFSELNDPEEQAARFRAQAQRKDAGDHEAMHYDADYVTALEYGMPPTAGEGIGIDRFVMLLTGQAAIRDVLLFPQMRPRRPD